ncbi:MAG TPA: hypothetical protein VIK64_00140 [Anaerolineales bacterium]
MVGCEEQFVDGAGGEHDEQVVAFIIVPAATGGGDGVGVAAPGEFEGSEAAVFVEVDGDGDGMEGSRGARGRGSWGDWGHGEWKVIRGRWSGGTRYAARNTEYVIRDP